MELPSIGQNCSECNTRDFLPLRCAACCLYFCMHHFAQHPCEPAATSQSAESTGSSQQNLSSTTVRCGICSEQRPLRVSQCSGCQTSYCIKHRHPFDHQCASSNTTLSSQDSNATAPSSAVALGRLLEAKKLQFLTDAKISLQVKQMKLKMISKGSQSIPAESRHYLVVTFDGDMNCRAIFVHKNWTVGKVLDVICEDRGLDSKVYRLFIAVSDTPVPGPLDLSSAISAVTTNCQIVRLNRP